MHCKGQGSSQEGRLPHTQVQSIKQKGSDGYTSTAHWCRCLIAGERWLAGTSLRHAAGSVPTEHKFCAAPRSGQQHTAGLPAPAEQGAAGEVRMPAAVGRLATSWACSVRALSWRPPPSMAARAARQTASLTHAWRPGGRRICMS